VCLEGESVACAAIWAADQGDYVGNRADSEPESPNRQTSLRAVRYVVSPRAPCALPPSTPYLARAFPEAQSLLAVAQTRHITICPVTRAIASPSKGRRVSQRVGGNTSVCQIPFGNRTRVSGRWLPPSPSGLFIRLTNNQRWFAGYRIWITGHAAQRRRAFSSMPVWSSRESSGRRVHSRSGSRRCSSRANQPQPSS